MPRKNPFSGKQKKKQLQEKKLRKQGGPSYLQDSDDDLESPASQTAEEQSTGAGETPECRDAQLPEVQRINVQPHRTDTASLDANSFRLHFFKEDAQAINKRKKEARKPVKPVAEEYRAWKMEDVYPSNAKLDFPKRLPWSYTASKEELEHREQQYFTDYVQDILDQPRMQDLSFFELNLETWRQLWRVLEMSDILLIIADIRYPALHVPPRLLEHVMGDLHKQAIILLNKVDLVPPSLALAWKRYLEIKFPGVSVVFFSSNPREVQMVAGIDPSAMLQKRPFQSRSLPVGPEALFETVKNMVGHTVDLSSWKEKLHGVSSACRHSADQQTSTPHSGTQQTAPEASKERLISIGCLGYPNAGKSSVLNALVGRKVVSVSKSPGHTKHFQTIFLSSTVRLCDCPGLVFPSMVPKSLQIIAGIFPVSQVKEPYSVVGYLAKRLDLPKLLHLQPPKSSPPGKRTGKNDGDYGWSPFDICEAWALKCGFTTSKAGRPDIYRAANKILRLAVEGQLCLCFTPSSFSWSDDALASDQETQQLSTLLSSRARDGEAIDVGRLQRESDEEDEDDDDDDDGDEESEAEDVQVGGMFDKLSLQDETGGGIIEKT